jgi:PAS domain-containing protein
MLNINNEYNILGTKFLIKLLAFLAIIILSFAANSFIFNGANVIGVFVLWTITSILFYLAIKKDFGKYSDEVANEIKNYSLYKDIVATSNNAAVVIDDNFKVVTFNEAAQRVLFATSIVLKTSFMHDFLYEEDIEAFKEYVLEDAGKEKSFRIKNAYFETFDRQYILSFFATKYIVEDKILYLIIINNFSEFYNNFSDVKKDKELLLGAINAIPLDIIVFDEKERSVFNKNQNDINTFSSLLDTIQLNKNVARQGFDIARQGDKFQQNIIVSNLNQIEKWQNLNFVPFKANDKNYVLYFQHDNTDYVKKYENLTNISNTYDGILRNSANAIIIVDTDGNIVELNPSFYQLYNLNADLISKDHFKIPLKDFLLMLNIDSIILNPDKITKKVIYKNGSIAAGIDTFFLNILDAEVFEAE